MTNDTKFSEYATRLRQFIDRTAHGGLPGANSSGNEEDSRFDQLALELFALQFTHNPAFLRICRSRKVSPPDVSCWRSIPAVPTAAFKELDLTSLALEERTAVFHSSGTTEQRPSRHFHNAESLALYEASLWPWFAARFLADLPLKSGSEPPPVSVKLRLLILAPSPALAPHSSLAYMFDAVRRRCGSPQSSFTGQLDPSGGWTLSAAQTLSALRESWHANQPIGLLGTAFSFVHLLDALAKNNLACPLPAGSRVLETGGYKGRSRSLPKPELHALITQYLGIPENHILSEYGMSELSSQAYDGAVEPKESSIGAAHSSTAARADGLCAPHEPAAASDLSSHLRVFYFPPWARARIISPETNREVPEGEMGLIQVFDLANVRSVMAIQTEDLGIRRGQGFELLGRATGAEARGCSLRNA
ncbi:MAG: hypothetical protein AAB676_14985 [Verrucomicrobiota bacterium]